MTQSDFSRAQGYQSAPEPLDYTEIPDWVRSEIFLETRRLGRTSALYKTDVFVNQLEHASRSLHRRIFGRNPQTEKVSERTTWAAFRFMLETAEWWWVFDLSQVVYRLLRDIYGPDSAMEFNNELNKIFEESGVVWRMKGEDFERVLDPVTEASLGAAQAILKESRFHGPDQQFRLALSQFS